ncbi:MAG: hypothetical protein WB347_08165, partial [Terriglobales bacterium]
MNKMRTGRNSKQELLITSDGDGNRSREKSAVKDNPVRRGRRHKISVRLMPPKGLPPLNVYARSGYYAP